VTISPDAGSIPAASTIKIIISAKNDIANAMKTWWIHVFKESKRRTEAEAEGVCVYVSERSETKDRFPPPPPKMEIILGTNNTVKSIKTC